jgi:4-hydroxy-tetrahydrodipicolinate reductase
MPGVLSLAWGSVVRQIAAGLGIELDDLKETVVKLPAPDTFEIASGTIEKGTMAALRFEVQGMYHGRPAGVLEHGTRLRPDLGPDWPRPPAGQRGSYAVIIEGDPRFEVAIMLHGGSGSPADAGNATAVGRIVNAIPAVVAAPPGIVGPLDLPLITGRGLL